MTEEVQTQDVKLPEPAWVWTKQPRNLQRILEGKHLLPEKGTGLYTADQVRAAVMAERERAARVAENTHPNDWGFIAAAIRSGSQD